MASISYGPGAINTDSSAVLQDGYVARNVLLSTTTSAGNADAVAFQNLNSEYVRLTIAFAAGTTTSGNLSKILPPLSSLQETFSGAVVTSVTCEAVSLPLAAPTGTSVAGLAASGNEHLVAISFLEN